MTAEIPYHHPAAIDSEQLLKNCTTSRQRTRGPGGQHRNKVETGVFLLHKPTGIKTQSTEFRSQIQNKKQALFRLRIRLALRHRTIPPIPGYQPSTLLKERLRQQKKKLAVNPKHQDYPAVLAEILDLVIALQGDIKKAGEYLGFISSSQIVKFLKTEPEALTIVNSIREKHGKHKLR